MSSPPELSGKWVACPFCHPQFVLPDARQVIIAATPPTSAITYVGQPQQAYSAAAQHRTGLEVVNGIRTFTIQPWMVMEGSLNLTVNFSDGTAKIS